MEQTKLKINKTAGILAIIGAAIFPLAFWFVAAAVVGDVYDIVHGGSGGSTPMVAWFFNIYALVGLAVFIYALLESKKANIKTTGHVLGIIGNAYFFISPIFPGIVAMILLILAAVFTLKQEQNATPPTQS